MSIALKLAKLDRPVKEGDSGALVKEIQTALRRAGHEMVLDGKFGAVTLAAVQRFQAASHIAPDGEVGPVTAGYLDRVEKPATPLPKPLPSVLGVAPWLTRARALTGTREISGSKSNPVILGWIKELIARWPDLKPDLNWYVNDDVPWCGLGQGSFFGLLPLAQAIKPPPGLLGAAAWATWGIGLKEPVQGCVAVKKRKGGNHVTLIEAQSLDGKMLLGRGANQKNAISLTWYPRDVFFAFRWPKGWEVPAAKLPVMTAGDVVAALGGSEA